MRNLCSLFAYAIDLDVASVLADAQTLARQEPSFARRLRDVAGGGQIAPAKITKDMAVLVDLTDVGQKYGLVDIRVAGVFFVTDLLDDAQGIVGLLAERRPATRNRRGEHVAHIAQVHRRIAYPILRRLPNRVRDHLDYPLVGGQG
jgi:hypothetical protein